MMSQFAEFFTPSYEFIASVALLLMTALIRWLLVGPPALWEYIIGGILWLVMTALMLIELRMNNK